MVKRKTSKTRHDSGTTITTESPYGSHKSMITNQDSEPPDGYVWCKDDTHVYLTLVTRLDNGLADPFRQGKKKND